MTIITGAIKIVNVPNDFCLTNITDLIKFLEANTKVEFDASEVTNIVISVDQPTDTSVIWYKISNSGNFIGVFVFVQSQWQQMFPVPAGIYRVSGNSNTPPPGYAVITQDTPGFSAGSFATLQSQWYQPPGETFYTIFDVVYVGL